MQEVPANLRKIVDTVHPFNESTFMEGLITITGAIAETTSPTDNEVQIIVAAYARGYVAGMEDATESLLIKEEG